MTRSMTILTRTGFATPAAMDGLNTFRGLRASIGLFAVFAALLTATGADARQLGEASEFTGLNGSSAIIVNTLDGGNDGICGTDGADALQDCSLLEAIALANSDPGADVVEFSVGGEIPISADVVITTPVTLDGTSAPGGSGAVYVNASGVFSDAIVMAGVGASGSEVRGMAIGQAPVTGIYVNSGAANVLITGNFIGTNPAGNDLGNGSSGVDISVGATDNTVESNTIGFNGGNGVLITEVGTTGNSVVDNFIGTNAGSDDLGNGSNGVFIGVGATAAALEGNTIGFNGASGVLIVGADTTGNSILGNYIGTNADGDDLGHNDNGVAILDASENTIGGMTPGEGNVIGFSGTSGVSVGGAGATGNRIVGNFIGTNAAGNDLGNGFGGVDISDGATNNTVGGTTPSEGNVIGFNSNGVFIGNVGTTGNSVLGNFIGTNGDGDALGNGFNGIRIQSAASNNTIGGANPGEANTIGFNVASGISLFNDVSGNSVLGNFIGTNATGDNLGNGSNGVDIGGASTDNQIGGAAPGAGNTIGFNGVSGVSIVGGDTTGNSILGNYIGTNAAGDNLGNSVDGVRIVGGASDNMIGGAGPGEGNIIGFNSAEGVFITSPNTRGNALVSNFIGTNAAGENLGNGLSGVGIRGEASENVIGGAGPGEGNTIGFNGVNGVFIEDASTTDNAILGNYIGTNAGGDDLANVGDGVVIRSGASDNLVGGTASGEGNTIGFNDGSGVFLGDAGTTSNRILGNYIGTNAAGADLGHARDGVAIGIGASDNTIGGAAAGEGNIIGFNTLSGVLLFSQDTTANAVVGNFMGTNPAGENLGNGGDGVAIVAGSSGNVIGGAAFGEGNTIGFNGSAGVFVSSAGTTGNAILGNFIGINTAGLDSGNGLNGVVIIDGSSGNVIGGAAPGQGNIIGFNLASGVLVSGQTTVGNVILGNAILDNAALGLDLTAETTNFGDGVTTNDGCGDGDAGPNGLQNFPMLVSALVAANTTTIDFDLDTSAGDYRVELFSVFVADLSGHGEGRIFLGAEQVSVSASCEESFQAELPLGLPEGSLVTATATPLDGGQPSGFGGTSEFSAAVAVEIVDGVFNDRFETPKDIQN